MTPHTLAQLEALTVEPGRPLLISDADEVLFRFVDTFTEHLEGIGYSFDWSSFRLAGNVRRISDGSPVGQDGIFHLLERLFAERTATIPAVDGAAEALARLNGAGAAIVVLTNIPTSRRKERARALVRNAMPYPVVANSGDKGPAVAWLAERAGAPVVFVDDGPNHHISVAEHAPAVTRLHFVATPRLARTIPKPDAADARLDDWAGLERAIAAALGLTCGGT